MRNVKWTPEEFLLCLYFYLTHDVNIRKYDSELIEFAKRSNAISPIKRTVASRYFRLMNYRYVDPKKGGKGFSGGKNQCGPFWEKYSNNLKDLKEIYEKFIIKTEFTQNKNYTDEIIDQELTKNNDEYIINNCENDKVEFIKIIDEINSYIIKEQLVNDKDAFFETVINIRNPLFQMHFKNGLIYEFKNKCAICGMDNFGCLIASHILPYSQCINKEDMINSNNGLLLCPNHDALFDKKLISFDQIGHISISNKISKKTYDLLCISDSFALDPKILNNERKKYMNLHMNIFKKIEEIHD